MEIILNPDRIRIMVDGVEYIPTETDREVDHIEMWYDRHLRLWTLYPVDAEGNQMDGAQYATIKSEAKELKRLLEEQYGI